MWIKWKKYFCPIVQWGVAYKIPFQSTLITFKVSYLNTNFFKYHYVYQNELNIFCPIVQWGRGGQPEQQHCCLLCNGGRGQKQQLLWYTVAESCTGTPFFSESAPLCAERRGLAIHYAFNGFVYFPHITQQFDGIFAQPCCRLKCVLW